ncbi:MAG: hypothetical protein KDK99_08495 [Verrucomicrobiales bacterium]|nr:hypothetical protein [Verrucomicrobiales bacterium]
MAHEPEQRNLGNQPLDAILTQHGLTHHHVVAASSAPLTHKTIQRARKGRWLKPAMKLRVTTAVNAALLAADPSSTADLRVEDLFNY